MVVNDWTFNCCFKVSKMDLGAPFIPGALSACEILGNLIFASNMSRISFMVSKKPVSRNNVQHVTNSNKG